MSIGSIIAEIDDIAGTIALAMAEQIAADQAIIGDGEALSLGAGKVPGLEIGRGDSPPREDRLTLQILGYAAEFATAIAAIRAP